MKRLALFLLTGFWIFNSGSHELQYRVGNHTCGAVSKSGQMYVADVMESGGAAQTGSSEFNTLDAAKMFVELNCKI